MRQRGLSFVAMATLVGGTMVLHAESTTYGTYMLKTRAWAESVKDARTGYVELLATGDAQAVVDRVVEEYAGTSASACIAGAGAAMADAALAARRAKTATPEVIAATMDILLNSASLPTRTAGAEVMLEMDAKTMGEGRLERAARLLDDPDPFVRGIAEWTIALQVGAENNTKAVPAKWSDETSDPPAWFTAWRATFTPKHQAEWDHVRQAVRLGLHRSPATLAASAPGLLSRVESLLRYAQSTSAPARPLEEMELAAAKEAAGRLEAAAARGDLSAARMEWLTLRRELRTATLAVAARWAPRIVYVRRRSFNGQHNISGNSQHQGKVPPPSDILVANGLDLVPPRSLLAGQLPPGSIRGMDLFFDADRVVFSYSIQTPDVWESWAGNHWQPGNSDYERPKGGGLPQNLWEIGLDGKGLKRLTESDRFVDMEPTYLADGSVVFASDRGCGSSECGGWEQNASSLNLFRVLPDGRVKRLTWNKDYDRYPHALNDGSVGYLRWDYQERGIFPPHTLWAIRPDGTYNDALFKQHLYPPHSLRDAVPVPGSGKLVAIGTGHHHLPEGWLIEVNPSEGVNTFSGMRALAWGTEGVQGGMPSGLQPVPDGGVLDSPHGRGGWYQTPRALNEKALLVSQCEHNGLAGSRSFGHVIYYQDVFGNKELVARDPFLELAYPMPLKARRKPPVLANVADPDQPHAVCYVSDVYTDLPGIERGTVKYIRISHRVDWTFFKEAYGNFRWYPHYPGFGGTTFGYWTWSGTRVIGTVPVQPDGSAYFKVPPYVPVYFQALDENRMEIRRMRSHIEFQPGEQRGCLGCHETRAQAPLPPVAGSRPLGKPDQPVPPPWGDHVMIDYESHVHPVLEKRCASCHGEVNPPKGIEFTARRDGWGMLQSYRSLFGLKWGDPTPANRATARWFKTRWPYYRADLAKVMDESAAKAWFKQVYRGAVPGQLVSVLHHQAGYWQVSMPKAFGSHRSKLLTTLLEDPQHAAAKSAMTPEEWEALVTFVDAMAPYSGKMLMKYDAEGRDLARVMPIDYVYPDPWADPDEYGSAGRPLIPDNIAERAKQADAEVVRHGGAPGKAR